MSDNYRIKVSLNNKSFTVGPDVATGQGATVIPASRGPIEPVKFNRGETENIISLFGADRYEILEAIAYNNKYPIWISAPHRAGAYGAMLLTDNGLLPVPLASSSEIPDKFSNILEYQYLAGIGDGSTTDFAISIPKELLPHLAENYPTQASIVIGDEVTSLNLVWSSSTFTASANGIIINGELLTNDIVVSITITTTLAEGVPISLRMKVDTSKFENNRVYALIGMKFPCEDIMAVAVHKSEIKDRLILDIVTKRKGSTVQLSGYPKEISLVPRTLNGSGANIYAPELLRDDNFIFILPNLKEPLVVDTWTGDNEDHVWFKGGFRGIEVKGDVLIDGWNQFKEFKKFPADIYFDSTADSVVPETLASLRSLIPYRRFLFPLSPNLKAKEVTSTSPARPKDRGLCAFWGAGYIQNLYEPTGLLLSTLMGEVASKYADARVLSYGGRSVAWGDENGVGGQLNQGRIIEFLYDATEDEMRELDKNRVNPIVMNDLFGPMIASRRTTDTSDTDYSYADYSMVIDYCVERIVNEVLPFQLIKFNDDEHRAVVKMKADMILKPLLNPPNNVLRDYYIKCDSENNNDLVLQQELFVLSVAIKVQPKAEYISFLFTNSAQGGSVVEDAG